VKAQLHLCDVCFLLDGDSFEKRSIYCSGCNAWICEADLWNGPRRAKAMLKRVMSV
jgi:hypothetical protein